MPIRKEFGNALWLYLHSMAQIAEDQDKNDLFLEILSGVAHLLPCPKCRKHYFAYKRKGAYQALQKGTEKTNYIHNEVNKLFNKKVYTLEESINEFKDIANKQIIVKNTFYEIVLSFSAFWGTDWTKGINLQMKNYLRKIIENTITLLNLGDTSLAQKQMEDENFYQYQEMYQILEQFQLDSKEVRNGFKYRTDGCNCLNK